MIPMGVIFHSKNDGGPLWPDLVLANVVHLAGNPVLVGVLEGGMTSGAPSVAIRIDLDDGRHVVVETTAKLFVSAAKLIEGRYPDLLK